MYLDVICVGAATFDTIASVPEMPGDDQRTLVPEFTSAGGGPAATAAVTLARLGAKVGFCGIVGDDAQGRYVREALESAGVLVSWLETSPTTKTAQSMVLVSESTNGRTIIASRAGVPSPSMIPLGLSHWIHVDQIGYAPTVAALKAKGVRSGPLLSVDAGNPIEGLSLGGVELYAPSVATLLARYPESSGISDAIALAIAEGARLVVATDGSNGTYLSDGGPIEHVEAFPIDVVSTLGAGDVFHGAILAALMSGDALGEAVRTANGAAALACRGVDGRAAIPGRQELMAFLNSQTSKRRSRVTSQDGTGMKEASGKSDV
jgi:sulfofructose kinase